MNIVSGSPLDARQNPLIYLVIVVLALIILAVLGILIVSKIIKKKHESPEYIQQQKKKIDELESRINELESKGVA